MTVPGEARRMSRATRIASSPFDVNVREIPASAGGSLRSIDSKRCCEPGTRRSTMRTSSPGIWPARRTWANGG
jgi:hypothetical protein